MAPPSLALPPLRISTDPPEGWNELVADSPRATFFHDARWIDLYARHHDGETGYLHATADGRLVGALAYVRFRRGVVHFYESLPLGTYGGPLTAPGPVQDSLDEALTDRFVAFGRHPLCVRVQCVIRNRPTRVRLTGFHDASLHLVPLADSFETFWQDVFPKNRRNECNRAAKRGVTVDEHVTHDDIAAYYPLDVAAHTRWRLRPHPEKFFHELVDAKLPGVHVFVVRIDGRLLGLHVCFRSGPELIVWHGVTSREGSKHYFPTSMLVRAEAMLGFERGLDALNLGASGDLAGIANFKKLVGGTTTAIPRYEWNHRALPLIRRLRGHA